MTPRSISLELPWPPSANNLFGNARRGRKKSVRYSRWEWEAALSIRSQRPGTIPGHYRLLIEATPPDRRQRDADNIPKAISDILVKTGVIADDSNCRKLTVLLANDVVKGGHIRAIITELAQERGAA